MTSHPGHIIFIRWAVIFYLGTFYLFTSCSPLNSGTENINAVRIVEVDSGWAGNSVNTAVFRKNSLVSSGSTQYIAFYNQSGFIVLGKRKIKETNWELKTTAYKGNVSDAHNVISIMVDGDGYLHVAWDHHNNRLHYARSLQAGSLELGAEIPMTGKQENKVTYPEFYRKTNGDIIFLYRDGGSGNGNLVINQYHLKTKAWSVLHNNLINGEGKRNAYWQACIDAMGTIHLSWVWRESPDVSSNHDMSYARSKDGGQTWEKSTGEKYQLPITISSAELACSIPRNSELINQTSMTTDDSGNPYIATYWRDPGTNIPQYHLIYNNGNWKSKSLGFRTTAFSLSGVGTKQIPIARPQVIAYEQGSKLSLAMIFRDQERNNKISIAICNELEKNNWIIKDLNQSAVGSWEPTYDTELWKKNKLLHLFVQYVEQVDAEGKARLPAQMVKVLEWKPEF